MSDNRYNIIWALYSTFSNVLFLKVSLNPQKEKKKNHKLKQIAAVLKVVIRLSLAPLVQIVLFVGRAMTISSQL